MRDGLDEDVLALVKHPQLADQQVLVDPDAAPAQGALDLMGHTGQQPVLRFGELGQELADDQQISARALAVAAQHDGQSTAARRRLPGRRLRQLGRERRIDAGRRLRPARRDPSGAGHEQVAVDRVGRERAPDPGHHPLPDDRRVGLLLLQLTDDRRAQPRPGGPGLLRGEKLLGLRREIIQSIDYGTEFRRPRRLGPRREVPLGQAPDRVADPGERDQQLPPADPDQQVAGAEHGQHERTGGDPEEPIGPLVRGDLGAQVGGDRVVDRGVERAEPVEEPLAERLRLVSGARTSRGDHPGVLTEPVPGGLPFGVDQLADLRVIGLLPGAVQRGDRGALAALVRVQEQALAGELVAPDPGLRVGHALQSVTVGFTHRADLGDGPLVGVTEPGTDPELHHEERREQHQQGSEAQVEPPLQPHRPSPSGRIMFLPSAGGPAEMSPVDHSVENTIGRITEAGCENGR